MGKRLEAARGELSTAAKALDAMRGATDLDTFEAQWQEFLGRITRVWNKTEAALKGDPKFYNSRHVKRVKDARKSDELIRYLARARDADEHTIEKITGRIPAGRQFEFDGPGGLEMMVRNPQITVGGSVFPMDLANATRSFFAPAEAFAKPVTVRGQTYAVPTSHLGATIDDVRLIRFAELGLSFYTDLLDSLQADGWDQN